MRHSGVERKPRKSLFLRLPCREIATHPFHRYTQEHATRPGASRIALAIHLFLTSTATSCAQSTALAVQEGQSFAR